MTDQIWIYILANFNSTPEFTDHEGIFQIDPVARTTQFLHVDNWPLANVCRSFEIPPPSIYTSDLNRIYYFGGKSVNEDGAASQQHDEIFYVDLDKINNQTLAETSTVIQLNNDDLVEFHLFRRTTNLTVPDGLKV